MILSLELHWGNVANRRHWDYDRRLITVLTEIAHDIDSIVLDILDRYPEYFLFGCYSQIILLTNNRLFESGRPYLRPHVGECHQLIETLASMLRDQVRLIRACVAACIKSADNDERARSFPDMGGMITRFRRRAVGRHPIDSYKDDDNATFQSDFLDLDLSGVQGGGVHRYFRLKWARSNQFWTYTFLESSTYSPHYTPAATDPFEFPHLGLAQQSAEFKRSLAASEALGHFGALLMSFATSASVLDSPQLNALMGQNVGEDRDFEAQQDFPGKLLGGAHYLFIPLGILALALYLPEQTLAHAVDFLPELRNHHVDGIIPRFARTMRRLREIRSCPEYGEFVDICERAYRDERASGCLPAVLKDAIQGHSTIPYHELPLEEAIDLGWKLYQWMIRRNDRPVIIGRIISRFCSDLWIATETDGSETSRRSYLDFISCFVVDRRATYFTNFMPMGSDRFSRTFFIDLALTGYQRGRLAQRLCDIATHRTVSIRDINRIRAISVGINEIIQDFNQISKDLDDPIGGLNHDDNLFRRLEDCLAGIGLVQQQLEQMNLFVTYGIRGRYLSARTALDQLRERTTDIRQDRISGFPMLSDFLERRVVEGVRDIERMADRFDYLRERAQDAYNSVRTKLDYIQTARLSKFTSDSVTVISDLRKTAEASNKLQAALTGFAGKQVQIMYTADILLYAGGTYYIANSLADVTKWIERVALPLLPSQLYGGNPSVLSSIMGWVSLIYTPLKYVAIFLVLFVLKRMIVGRTQGATSPPRDVTKPD
jgi:hypothetical protein